MKQVFRLSFLAILAFSLLSFSAGEGFGAPSFIQTPKINTPEIYSQAIDTLPPQFVVLSFEFSHVSPLWQLSLEMLERTGAKATYFVRSNAFISSQRVALQDIVAQSFAQGNDVVLRAQNGYDNKRIEKPGNWRQFIDSIKNDYTAGQNKIEGRTDSFFANVNLFDTSGGRHSEDWPQRASQNDPWFMPLSRLALRKGAQIPASDYALFVYQSKAKSQPDYAAFYQSQAYHLLIEDFNQRYETTRAPLFLSLHFALWNKGSYWRAFEQFLGEVCTLSEVRCVNHGQLARYLEKNIEKTGAKNFLLSELQPLPKHKPKIIARELKALFKRDSDTNIDPPTVNKTLQPKQTKKQTQRDPVVAQTLPPMTPLQYQQYLQYLRYKEYLRIQQLRLKNNQIQRNVQPSIPQR